MKVFLSIIVLVSIGLFSYQKFSGIGSRTSSLKIKDYDLAQFQQSIPEAAAIVDVEFIHTKGSILGWGEIAKSIKYAQQIFAEHGVYLNITRVSLRDMPLKWHKIQANELKPEKTDKKLDFYDQIIAEENSVSQRSEKIFRNLIGRHRANAKTIYIITINEVMYSFWDKDKNSKDTINSITTGGLSFPSYVFKDKIPKDLRGVITLSSIREGNDRIIAHELGHKLINVSHEGLEHCPKFSGDTIPGLMGYSKDIAIYKGKVGRWHYERLMLSPYIYRLVDGQKKYKPDFKQGGVYRDPIYLDYVVSPACP